jgi:N-formylglutamate amidohydrolase
MPKFRASPSISIRAPSAAIILAQAIDAEHQEVVEEARHLDVQERLNRIERQFLPFEHQLSARLSERENSNRNLERQLI